MRRSRRRLCVCLIPLIAAGCSPEPRRVFVDVDSVLALEHRDPIPSPSLPQTPEAFPAFRGGVPALPGKAVSVPLTRARVEAAKKLVQSSDESAFEALAQQLRDIRVAQITREANARIEALKPEAATFRKEALARALEDFQAASPTRGRALDRLSLIVGFPDPDPLSERDIEPASRRIARRLEEAKSLREIIRTFDADVADRDDALDAAALDRYYKALAEIYDDLDRAKLAAGEDALKEAQAQRLQAKPSVGSIVEDGAEGRLKAVRAASVDFPPGPRLSQAPRSTSGRVDGADQEREQIETDLQIWMAANGYVAAKSKGSARDATEEFMEWRNAQRIGR